MRRRGRSPFGLGVVGIVLVIGICASVGFFASRMSARHSAAIGKPAPVAVLEPQNESNGLPALPPFDANHFEEMNARSLDRRIPVIMYHDVIKSRGKGSVWFDITTAELQDQLDFFTTNGAQPISLAELHEHLVRGKAVPQNAIVLTFDDNYQGFYDNAYPLLKAHHFPAAMFVHTNYVGDKKGDHPHMDWPTLQLLDKDGLVTIGSHTLSHPDDITKLTPEQQEEEMAKSKAKLESKLGHTVPYFAYPDGKNDSKTRGIAQNVGYTMAFTIHNGLAEESPGIIAVDRYIHTRYKKAWEDAQEAINAAPAVVVEKELKKSPVLLEIQEYAGVKLGLVRGGTPSSIQPPERRSVGMLVKEANGVAGINGTFFADARLAGISNLLIGPSQTQTTSQFIPETDSYHLRVISNRPVVVWGPTHIAIVPFQPALMNTQEGVKAFMPDFTDMFVAGSWIVHEGTARRQEVMDRYGVKDAKDPRRRAFLGITTDGEMVLGATLDVVTTEQMAAAAAEAGVAEAVLLDSGFSTSLVYSDKVIVTGHTSEDIPSRPVPHAIVLSGEVAPITNPAAQLFLQESSTALVAAHDEEYYKAHPPQTHHRRHHRISTFSSSDDGTGDGSKKRRASSDDSASPRPSRRKSSEDVSTDKPSEAGGSEVKTTSDEKSSKENSKEKSKDPSSEPKSSDDKKPADEKTPVEDKKTDEKKTDEKKTGDEKKSTDDKP